MNIDITYIVEKRIVAAFITALLCAVTVAFSQPELVKNGDFSSNSLANWTLSLQNGAAATQTVVNGELVIDITRFAVPDSAPRHENIRLLQPGVALKKSLDYEITFRAKSEDIGYQLHVYLGQNSNPWANYSGLNYPYLNPDWESYSVAFTMDSADDADARLVLELGDVAGGEARKVYLDDISVKAVGAGVRRGRIAFTGKAKGTNAMLYGRVLAVSGISSPVSAELFDASGQRAEIFGPILPNNGTALFTLNRTIVKGLYMVRIMEINGHNSAYYNIFRIISR